MRTVKMLKGADYKVIRIEISNSDDERDIIDRLRKAGIEVVDKSTPNY